MNNADDKLAEFDEDDALSNLPAAIADPSYQAVPLNNPQTNILEEASQNRRIHRWKRIPMPVRERAFFLWVEFGDMISVASELGMKLETVRHLHKKDGWEARVEKLRAGLEKTFLAISLKSRHSASMLALSLLDNIDPEQAVKLLDGKDIVRLITTLATTGDGPGTGLNVMTGAGPTQINIGGTPDKSLEALSDEELVGRARAMGVEVQPDPSGTPPSLPEGLGEPEETVIEASLDEEGQEQPEADPDDEAQLSND